MSSMIRGYVFVILLLLIKSIFFIEKLNFIVTKNILFRYFNSNAYMDYFWPT